jgi:hypothetical protein
MCCGAGSETRTRMTVKSLVFETSASTIPPFPQKIEGLEPLFLSSSANGAQT